MRVAWTRIALAQLDEIQDYIAQDSPAAAHKVVQEIVVRTERVLSGSAYAGRVGRARNTRELIFGDLPYIVVYRVGEAGEILAVVHGARQWPDQF